MSELSDLLANSEIEFPRPIDLNEVKNLMMLIAKDMPAHVGYAYTTRGEINTFNEESEELTTEESDAEFRGTITHRKTLGAAHFRLNKVYSREESKGYGSLKFDPSPGHNPGEHSQEEVRVWGETKAIIGKYFSQKDPSGVLSETK